MKDKIKIKNCKICGKEFNACPPQNCLEEANMLIKSKFKHKTKENYTLNSKEGKDYVTCQICGEKTKRIFGKHLKIVHNITSSEYKKLFPGFPLSSEIDKYNTSKNSGKFMKEEK